MVLITKRQERSSPLNARSIQITYTTDVSEAERWLRVHILDCSVAAVGFDIEWKPQFVSKKDGGTENETAVLQLAVEASCLVLHIYRMPTLPRSLALLLSDENIVKVGSGIVQDGLKLERDTGLVMRNSVGIQRMAKELCPGLQKTGIKALARHLLGIEIDKTEAMSDWEQVPLDSSQIKYAALDAWFGLKIFRELKKRQLRLQGECIDATMYDQETQTKTLDKCAMICIAFSIVFGILASFLFSYS